MKNTTSTQPKIQNTNNYFDLSLIQRKQKYSFKNKFKPQTYIYQKIAFPYKRTVLIQNI
jgi:hypothetical protein